MLLALNEVVKEAVALYAMRLKLDNIKLITEYEKSNAYIYGDKNRLQQVIVNIINNAHHALTDEPAEQRELNISTHIHKENIQVFFENNGPEIPKENLGKIFDPFYTSKDVNQGTGLGLSVSYGIVRDLAEPSGQKI